MYKLLLSKLPLISFIFIPILFLWHPNWLSVIGVQPYWPIFWLLPISIIYGPKNGILIGLFLGLTMDAITSNNSFTQIPGLIFCGFWFGRFKILDNFWVGHFRYGLISSIGTFVCGTIYFLQIIIKNFSSSNFYFFFPSIKNVLVQVFITGLLAPFFCALLMRFLKDSRGKKNYNKFKKI